MTKEKRKPDFYEQAFEKIEKHIGATEKEYLVEITEEQLKKAKKRLDKNLKKEAEEIDPRCMFLKLKKAFIEQYDRVNAANTRANDNEYNISNLDRNLAAFKREFYEKIKDFEKYNKNIEGYTQELCEEFINNILKDKIQELDGKFHEIQTKLDFQQKIFSQAIKLIESQQPWYKKLWSKIASKSSI